VTAVASESGPVVSPMIGKRLGSPPREHQPRTSHLRADAGPCIAEWLYFGFASAMFLNSNTLLSMYLFCKSRIHVITLYSDHVCMYYASMLQCWHLIWILVRTDHPCLGVACHSWYQSHTSLIRHWRPYFQKPTGRIRFNARIRTIVVLTGGKLIGIYFLQFTFCNDAPTPM
jgi:hypothetical protein